MKLSYKKKQWRPPSKKKKERKKKPKPEEQEGNEFMILVQMHPRSLLFTRTAVVRGIATG
jgi:hypothetical protein